MALVNGSSPTDVTTPLPPCSTSFDRDAVAIVVGGTRGIGFGVSLGLASRGIHVILGARDSKAGVDAAESIEKHGLSAEYIELDCTNQASIDSAVRDIGSRFGKVDILVNCAGIMGAARGLAETPEVFRAVYDVNVIAPFQIIKAFLPMLKKAAEGGKGRGARVVNMSSAAGSFHCVTQPDLPFKPTFAYTSSKAALNMITVQLARELSKDNIKVNASDPGWCATELTGNKGPRSAAQGAVAAIHLATMAADGPTGAHFNENGRHWW